MGLKNDFYGVYKIGEILTGVNGATTPSPYIIKELKTTPKMDASAIFYMQGDPRTRILDINHTSETLTVTAPILVPQTGQSPANLMDGRILLADKVDNSYTNGVPNNILPMLVSATLNIGENESNIVMELLSDGDPNNTINVYQISNTSAALINAIGLNYAARVAKNWDFTVQLGDLIYYLESATIQITVKHNENNFLGVAADNYWASNFNTVPTDGLNNGQWPADINGVADPSYTGWQFPFISVGGITITVSGVGVMTVDSDNPANNINYNRGANVVSTRPELMALANVTLQNPGELTFTQNNFTINQIYKDGSSVSVIPSAMAVNSAIVTQKTASFSADLLKVNFEVLAFVGAS